MLAVPCCSACLRCVGQATRDASVLVAAAVCPHPPLLVPDAAGAAAGELDDLRAAADAAVGAMSATEPDLIVTVGGATEAAEFAASAAGSLAGYGVAWRTGDGSATLPLSLTIGRWLMERAGLLDASARRSVGPSPRTRLIAVASGTPTAECLRLGAQIARRSPRVALLVMGDASARRSEKAPGFFDARAGPYDEAVQAALAGADARRLAQLDPGLSVDLLAAGRAAWQVLAGAAGDGAYDGHLHFAGAPYGVCYLVASWRLTATRRGTPRVAGDP